MLLQLSAMLFQLNTMLLQLNTMLLQLNTMLSYSPAASCPVCIESHSVYLPGNVNHEKDLHQQ